MASSTGRTLPKYTWEEIEKHRSLDSLWVVSNDFVYDITKFVPSHPGGSHTLLTCAAQDITYLIWTSHPFTTKPSKILEKYKIGLVDGPFVKYATEKNVFYDEVKQKVKEYFDKTGKDPKDPLPSLLFFCIIFTMWCVGYYFSASRGLLWAAAMLGVSRALFGINTMHAASHFSITHKPWVWRWVDWFCFDILMGGSSMAWNYQHIIGHHQHTNVFKADPDLPIVVEGDIRMVFPFQRHQWLYKYQAYYMPLLYTLLAFKTRYSDALILFGDVSNGNIKMNVTPLDYKLLVLTKIFFVGYQFLIPLFYFQLPVWEFLLAYIVAELAAGTWLAYFFQVNHISEEVEYTTKDALPVSNKEWAVLQVEGTIEYAHDSLLYMFLSGTLNYQAVHHLFPSVAPHHYPALAKIIRPIAAKHKVNYQVLPNFSTALIRHVKELNRMGSLMTHTH